MPRSGTVSDILDIPDLSRVAFFDGQRLAAGDLNDAAAVQRELRWLHNRSLHSWGIGLGFAVSGAKGERQVLIGPGYALDAVGREIILTEPVAKAVPARAELSTYYLVAAYPNDSELTVLERQAGECNTDGAVRLQERAAIYWKRQGEQRVESGIEIVLAQALVQNCQLDAPLSVQQRRTARPPQQPYVAAGATSAGETTWQPWTVELSGKKEVIGVTTKVDTTSGQFGALPHYQAQLRGQRYFVDPAPDVPNVLLVGTEFTSDAGRDAFTFSILLPIGLTAGMDASIRVNHPDVVRTDRLLNLVNTNWSVVWVGVEG
jgi:hypothetical protein